MKIMGLPNWLNWVTWFVKTLGMMSICVLLLVLLLSVRWYPNSDIAVLTHADWSLLLFFMLFYVCATVTLTFAMSACFSTGNKFSIHVEKIITCMIICDEQPNVDDNTW